MPAAPARRVHIQRARFGTAARDQRGRKQPGRARGVGWEFGEAFGRDGHQVLREDLPLRRRDDGERLGVH